MIRTTTLALCLAMSTTAMGESSNANEPAVDGAHYDLELLYQQGDHVAGLQKARERYAANPDDEQLTWHIARFLFEKGESIDRSDTSVDKVALYSEMVEVAEAGLAQSPDDPHIRFARGVANGRLGTTRGVIASLWSAQGIEEDWLYVSRSGFEYSSIGGDEMLPCDADLALGIFYRLVPDRWIVKMIAGTKGDLDKSLAHLGKADQCAPNRIGTMKELGVTQLCIASNTNDEAMMAAGRQTVADYMKLPAEGDKDRIDLKHGTLLLDDPSIACGYSRDGQQDLDTSEL